MFIRNIYTLFLFILSPILLYGLYKKKPNAPNFGSRWKEHFGLTPKLNTSESPIWIHAVSVGESILASCVIRAIKKKSPYTPILVTTTTATGAEQISKLGDLVEHRYMPIDFGFSINHFLKKIKPSKLIIIETELWPNTLYQVSKANIEISIINARLSKKSFRNYSKILPLFKTMSESVSQWLCQSPTDAERFIRLGVPQHRIRVTGSVKFDIQIDHFVLQQSKRLRNELGEGRKVWIAASTHQGEDQQILEAHEKILLTHPDTLLILVPRHPERFDSVYELCTKNGFVSSRRTSTDPISRNTQVYLADTMGEMLILIGTSDVCFMGGSLLGKKVGGHNVLEPAALNIPTITGPSFFNFKEIINALLTENGILVCNGSSDLAQKTSELLDNVLQRQLIAKNARQLLERNQGALDKTVKLLNC